MHDNHDEKGELLPDEQRITRLGSFLRRTSLDELPELWNVIRGEMSWVGPRPLLVQYLERYSPEQARRHNVLPALPVGHRSMVVMPYHGRKNLNWMFGMWITGLWIGPENNMADDLEGHQWRRDLATW